jgi:hypothetical protein
LYECRQNLAASLQQRVASYYLQKALQAYPPVLNHIVRETVCEDLARQGWYCYARRFSLEDVAESFEFAVSAAYDRVLKFEGGNVGGYFDFVRRVHAATDTCKGISLL